MKKPLPTLYCVFDVETTYWKRIVFDAAWKIVDKRGRVYGTGSYLVTDALGLDIPFFKEKLGFYFEDVGARYIIPATMAQVKAIFNKMVGDLIALGYKVIFCAYNARFDADHLGKTCHLLIGLKFLDHPMILLDIWHSWCLSAPKNYNKMTDKGNPKTSAEAVFQFEFSNHDFVERHIAFADVEIEVELLLKVLRRKKKLPFVNHPTEFKGQPWRLLLDRPMFAKQPKTFFVAYGTQYELWESEGDFKNDRKKKGK